MTKKRATLNTTPTKSNMETKRLKVLGKNGHLRKVAIMEAVKVKTSKVRSKLSVTVHNRLKFLEKSSKISHLDRI